MYLDYDTPRLTGPYLGIHAERDNQKGRLGAEEHTVQEWLLVLVEHVGHLAETVLAAVRDEDNPGARLEAVRREATETGAGIIGLLEHLDSLQSIPT
ncbi:hypothetical protein OG824_31535 [Streptomyces prunicolor]|uniref:hypothetical protein n=1 Tax=Streptomyces prunicolor TaxID=67348 RepID=UPI002258A7E7|nr:hypothetical protein [Streptomyces prunicolor]MCX5239742.1 hypothetical protein [Streptomyces prunicolor]